MMLFGFSARAGNITEEQARAKAQSFLKGRSSKAGGKRLAPARTPKGLRSATTGQEAVYVFNVGEQDGFVIVSGDDRSRSILGYADRGAYDAATVPAALNEMLTIYARQIELLAQSSSSASSASASHAPRRISGQMADVAPLLTTTWDQGTPYNAYCPTLNDQTALTGCVATAMAQIANYHKYPTTQVPSLAAYTSATNKINVAAWGATTFDWDNMLDSYSGTYTNAQKTAMATLMRYCGQAAQMDYGFGSGAYNGDALYAFKEKLGYNANAEFRLSSAYSSNSWENLIYKEIYSHRPVYYSALNGNAGKDVQGHAFVIDGYRADGNYFHVNWGWGGACNGYFCLFALNPDEPETEDVNDAGWHYQMLAIVGLSPETVERTKLTINVATSGTLATLIEEAVNGQGCNVNEVTDITVTGTINDQDLATLSSMCSGDYSLSTIDLGGADIEGGRIGDRMFYDRENLTAITLPATLQSIGFDAFNGCGLTSVTIGPRLTSIDASAFNISNIKDIYCYTKTPASSDEWSPAFFGEMPSEAVLHVLHGREGAFRTANGWETFPNIVGDLESTTLTFDITTDVTAGGSLADALQTAMTAAGCTDMADISRLTVTGNINHDDLEYIAEHLGRSLDVLDLGAATLENNNWGEDMFDFAGWLEFVLPESLERYEGWGFIKGHGNLKTIHIPDHFGYIPTQMLGGCSSLETVTGGDGLTGISGWSGSFARGCPNLKAPIIMNGLFLRLPMNTSGAYEVPGHATLLACTAMSEVQGLTSLTLPESITEIQPYVFAGDTNLRDIYYHAVEMPNTWDGAFGEGFDCSACTLHVYAEMVNLFQNDEHWKDFNIVGDLGEMPNTSPMNEADYADLCNIFQTLNGTKWRTRWHVSNNVQTVSRWHGVTFDEEGYVTAIDLRDNRLNGDISALTFTGLSRLTNLDLSGNALSGDIQGFAAKLPRGCTLNVERQDLGYIGEHTLYGLCNYGELPSIAYCQSGSGTLVQTLMGVGGYCLFHQENAADEPNWEAYIYANGNTTSQGKFSLPSPATVECFYPHHFTFTYKYEMGDANMDDVLNVLDLQSTLGYSNNQQYGLFNFCAADTYGQDKDINVQDIVTTVNMLLAQEGSDGMNVKTLGYARTTEGEACLIVEDGQLVLYTSKPVAALDLRLAGIGADDIVWKTEDMGFVVATKGQDDTHAIIYSMLPRQIEEGRTVIATFDENLRPRLVSALLSDIMARPVTLGGSIPTQLRRIAEEGAQAAYDLRGIEVNSPQQKGVYIVNGKKVVIK